MIENPGALATIHILIHNLNFTTPISYCLERILGAKLNLKKSKTVTIIILFLALSIVFIPNSLAETYNNSYHLINLKNLKNYNLNIAISESLYEYYLGKDHNLNYDDEFAKFVTPYTLKPIADNLWKIYADDEDFANAVLMIVHQIPYNETVQPKYPIETLVENRGDCDLFSYVAASILKAGGLDVVLLYYKTQSHMNIGVHLSHEPHEVRGQSHYVTYAGIKYYIAECTGDNWRNGWRVGECPPSLTNAPVKIITLENCEKWAPGQVTASYKTLIASSITFNVSPLYVLQGGTVTLSGKLSPELQNATVTIYVEVNGFQWNVLNNVKTDNNGVFRYSWKPKSAGVYYLRASWSGNDNYAGADSKIETVTVFSFFFISLIIITVILFSLGLFIFLTSKSNKQSFEPSPPEIPV